MTDSKKTAALLVGLQTPEISDAERDASLEELSRLVTTLGYRVIGQMSQRRSSSRSGSVLGDGKLQELAWWTGGSGLIESPVLRKRHKAAQKFTSSPLPERARREDREPPEEQAEVVIFDCDLSPSQLRNLENATGVKVLDRPGVIIEIFSRHARTRVARLQVEIAQLTYVAPRLRETAGSDDQQGGGGKGLGETSLELDRRKIRDRIKELKQEFQAISQEHATRRARREQEITVALVGYTNAGKSSLMRALTGSEVLVEDKLFATLDTTVRILQPETQPRILISDTVGFIRKLPHDLVASFKSTLDEALHASLLLYVVDASDPTFPSQLQVTREVLAEVGAGETPTLQIFNKIDRLSASQLIQLQERFPEALFLSALQPEDVANLRLHLVKYFESAMLDQDLFVPYDVQGAVGDIRSRMKVLAEDYSDRGVTLRVRGPADVIKKIKMRFGI